MKNGLKMVMAISMMFVINFSQAQIKFGPKVGVNLSNMTLTSSGLSLCPVGKTGMNVGFVSEIPLKNSFVLQPGILYSTKGSNYHFSGSELSILPTYIEIPVNVMCKSNMGIMNMLVFAGPYAGIGVGGQSNKPAGLNDIMYGSGADSDMKAFDFGMNIGAGFELFAFQLTAQYGFSLTNLAPANLNDKVMKNRVVAFSVAYLIGNE